MPKILGHDVTLRKKDGDKGQAQGLERYDNMESVNNTLEERGALKMVMDNSNTRDSASFALDSIEFRIKNLEEEKKLLKDRIHAGKLRDINEMLEILSIYRSLLFRCAYLGARNNPQMQRKLAALHSLLERKIEIPGYRPRLRVLINHVWSISWTIIEGKTPPPILINQPQVFPVNKGFDITELKKETVV